MCKIKNEINCLNEVNRNIIMWNCYIFLGIFFFPIATTKCFAFFLQNTQLVLIFFKPELFTWILIVVKQTTGQKSEIFNFNHMRINVFWQLVDQMTRLIYVKWLCSTVGKSADAEIKIVSLSYVRLCSAIWWVESEIV